jgi:hypothetical protein
MYFVEFLEPKSGVELERFQRVVAQYARRWAADHPEDELVMNVGRTWWLGPTPAYLTVWKVSDVSTLNRWGREVGVPGAHELHREFAEVATIVQAGLYEDIGEEMA